MQQIKNIYATITNHVQIVGFREVVEIHAKEDIRLPSPFGRIVIDEMREISLKN